MTTFDSHAERNEKMGPFDFEYVGGSMVGKDHMSRNGVLIGKPNQDAICDVHLYPHHRVFVVCDGCGSTKFPEVGARIGALETCHVISGMLNVRPSSFNEKPTEMETISSFMNDVMRIVAQKIDTHARVMSDWKDPSSYLEVLSDYFLFTIMGAILVDDIVIIFNIGDGYFVLNGDVIKREAGDDNAPAYLAYDLFPDNMFANSSEIRMKNKVMFECFPLADVDSLIISTDGFRDIISNVGKNYPGRNEKIVPPVEDLCGDDFFKNPMSLQRELSMMNGERITILENGDMKRHPGLLSDDTSLYMIRRDSR